MRLFVALDFTAEDKKRMAEYIHALRGITDAGSFTRIENLHMTLAFIGETKRKEDIIAAMDACVSAGFTLHLQGAGTFPRKDGAICFLGALATTPLETLHKELIRALLDKGFSVDTAPLKPHITLARRAHFSEKKSIDDISASFTPIDIPVETMTLFKSESAQGKLTYTPLYVKPLACIQKNTRRRPRHERRTIRTNI